MENLDRYRRRYEQRAHRARSKAGQRRCDVWMCGKRGPHPCPEVARVGERTCLHHARMLSYAPERVVFTAEDALAAYRASRKVQRRVEIDPESPS